MTDHAQPRGISRRNVAKGVLWSVPVVALASAAPAFASSACTVESATPTDPVAIALSLGDAGLVLTNDSEITAPVGLEFAFSWSADVYLPNSISSADYAALQAKASSMVPQITSDGTAQASGSLSYPTTDADGNINGFTLSGDYNVTTTSPVEAGSSLTLGLSQVSGVPDGTKVGLENITPGDSSWTLVTSQNPCQKTDFTVQAPAIRG